MHLYRVGNVVLGSEGASDSLSVQARSALVQLPNGAFDPDGSRIVLQPGSISRQWVIRTNMQATIDALLAELAQGRLVVQAQMPDGSFRQTFGKLRQFGRNPTARNYNCEDTFSFLLDQDYPFWMSSADEPNYLNTGLTLQSGKTLADGQWAKVTLNSLSHSLTIPNTGGAPVARGTIIITPASGGSITNLTITNEATGSYVRYVQTLSYGDWLSLVLISKTAWLNGSNASAAIATPEYVQDWLRLELGNNDILIEANEITGDVDFRWQWSKHYL